MGNINKKYFDKIIELNCLFFPLNVLIPNKYQLFINRRFKSNHISLSS